MVGRRRVPCYRRGVLSIDVQQDVFLTSFTFAVREKLGGEVAGCDGLCGACAGPRPSRDEGDRQPTGSASRRVTRLAPTSAHQSGDHVLNPRTGGRSMIYLLKGSCRACRPDCPQPVPAVERPGPGDPGGSVAEDPSFGSRGSDSCIVTAGK
jgi:hypothetical protein